VTNQKQLDLSKPCVTEPGGVPCRFGSSSYSGEILIWNLLREGYCDIKHYTDLHGNPLIFGFPRVVNVPEPDPLEQLDWDSIWDEVDDKSGYKWDTKTEQADDERLIKTAYRVVAAKLEELKAKETNND
jgi:hypothetical protein